MIFGVDRMLDLCFLLDDQVRTWNLVKVVCGQSSIHWLYLLHIFFLIFV